MSLWDRLKDFPGETLTLENGKIYCSACSEILNSKKSTVRDHCRSAKHKKSKAEQEKSKCKAQTIAQALRRSDANSGMRHAGGRTLPMDMRVWRMRVLHDFLSAGIPVCKIDDLRGLLESNNYRLTDSSNLSKLIPLILKEELLLIKAELRQPGTPEGQYVARELSIIFDGSTRLGEAIVVIIRFLDDDWKVQQRLIRLDVVAHAVTGEQLAQVLQGCLVDFTIHGPRVLGSTRDGASVNGAAMAILRPFCPRMLDLTCLSHTLDNVGQHFDTPTADEFLQSWISLFAHSCKAKLRWRERTGVSVKSYSETRWWSRWEVLDQACTYFGDIEPFLDENNDLAPKTMDRLRAIFADEVRLRNVQLELAALVDVGRHFVQATYILEGDGPLILSAYKRLQEVLNACNVNHLPNIHAVATRLADANPALDVQVLKAWAKARVQPGITWFLHKFNVQLLPMVQVFRYVRYFCPVQVQMLQPNAEAIEELRCLPFLDDAIITGLQGELAAYLAACDGCREMSDLEKVEWWQQNGGPLPHWASAVRRVLVLQVSSAAAERVFSLLKAAFSEQQQHALTDYLQASLMLRFNKRGQA